MSGCTPGTAEGRARGPQVALVVDDDPVLRRLVRRCAERAGFRVEEAGDLDELAQLLTRSCPDLIVLDLSLGHVPGPRLLERLAALDCPAAVLPLTGLVGADADRLVDLGRQLGLRLHPPVAKPVGMAQLTAELSRFRDPAIAPAGATPAPR